MMSRGASFTRKGDKHKYAFADAKCIGRKCWAPGLYQHRGATLSGSRNTGSPDSPCCMSRAYHGCPDGPVGREKKFDPDLQQLVTICGLPEVSPELTAKRKAEGWKLA
jgi:hypothetical protein